ncbi:MAG: preprotein translocase subunit SecA [Patescibacteria group bacterium]|nr:preprotein translocase subunit SecA [Patescibacteria group bacterium]
MSIIRKIFGDANEKYLKKLQPIVEKINKLEPEFESFSNEKLKEKTGEFKERLKKGETLDDLLPEAFALVREAAKRTLNQRHFDVQLIGGIVLHQGKIAEMKTGEGKTLAATLPLYLNALEGKGTHLVTVNDYLARRDTVWMGQIYHLLGLSVGCLNHEQSFLYDPDFKKPPEEKEKMRDELGSFYVVEDFLRPCSRKEAYLADITYGTNNEFGFDYLRDNMVYDLNQQAQRGFHYAIIDEVDSILIDEARTPLIISAPDVESSKWYGEFAKIMPHLKENIDYQIDEKMRAVTLTEEGINKIEKILGMENIYQEKGIKYLHHLEQALRAEALFKKDRDYVVRDGQIIIVDEFTGRLMPGRRWSGGLHQAIEAKEGVRVQPESLTLASITFQNYFRMYHKLAGMTGTAATSAEEFDKVYGLEVIVVPTNKPMIRKDLPDRVYKTEKGKFEAVVKEIKERHQKGQPVLVGTTSIEKNEYLGKLLDREGIPHQILNAKNHEREGEIIAQAGKLGAVTIATNMAGRGVDIILGGNPPNPEEAKEVIELGGLHVIGTERHEARRIDNQLRGRAGRQGDPGSSQFFVSLEDDLMRIFGGERIKSLMGILKIPEDQPIEANLVSGVIESAQSKIEGLNFDLRKYVLDYDDVLNKHREVIYKKRREILEKAQKNELSSLILEMIKKAGFTEKEYKEKEKEIGEENMRQVEKIISLRILDMLWMEHLENMEYLRDSVRLRAYGQQDPLVEYKNEGHKMFQRLLATMESNIANTILRISLAPFPPQVAPSLTPRPYSLKPKNKPGRNDPCPCGKINPKTGKPMKYKKCCWPKYG